MSESTKYDDMSFIGGLRAAIEDGRAEAANIKTERMKAREAFVRPGSDYLGAQGVLRVEDDGLYLPKVTLSHTDGRTVDLIGVMHAADADYWRDLGKHLADLLDAGKVVQMEIIRSSVVPAPEPNLAMKAYRAMTVRWIEHNGLTLQKSVVVPMLDRMEVTDMSLERLKERLGPDSKMLMVALVLSYPGLALLVGLSRDKFVTALSQTMVDSSIKITEHDALVASGGTPTERMARRRHRDRVIIDERNAIAIEAIDSAGDQTTAVWGAAHVPGIVEGLRARGWGTGKVTWRRCIESPHTEKA